jgi:hypothetical protein
LHWKKEAYNAQESSKENMKKQERVYMERQRGGIMSVLRGGVGKSG